MKAKAVKEHPVLFSLMLGIVLTLIISVASAVATIMEAGDTGMMIAQACAFLIMAIIVTLYMRKRDRTFGRFGFRKGNPFKEKEMLYYIPLLIIVLVQPVMGGFNPELNPAKILLILIFSLLVGYAEESIFRGIIKERLQAKGAMFYITFSSLFFGILHMANALNGNDIISTLLQVINAFLIGLILALAIEASFNIIPLIAFHFLYDALAQMTNPQLVDKEIWMVSILNIFYLLYGGYLLMLLLRRNKTKSYSGASHQAIVPK